MTLSICKPGGLAGGRFGFTKPHAVTDKVRELAMAGLEKAGLKVVKESSFRPSSAAKAHRPSQL